MGLDSRDAGLHPGVEVDWGYRGTHTDRMAEDIRLSDVRWIVRYLERLSDAPLRSGLLASGATPDEPYFYTRALRMGIQQIQKVARGRTMVARAK